MCVLIAQREGSTPLTEEEIDYGWTRNPDGGGFAYIDWADESIRVHKFMEKDEFKQAYADAHELYGESSPFLVHMRIATHGGVSLETTHPFWVHREEGAMVFGHNGIISLMDAYTQPGVSDTIAFSEWVLEGLPLGWLDNSSIVELVEEYIGSSKLAFLTLEPQAEQVLYILNESFGYWGKDGMTWFSNHSCEQPVVKIHPHRVNYHTDYSSLTSYWESKEKNATYYPGEQKTVWHSDLYPAEKKDRQFDTWLAEEEAPETFMPRIMINDEILKQGGHRVSAEAKSQGYCEYCLYRPCQCDTTCYYCNRPVSSCSCGIENGNHITISDMLTWTGFAGFIESRQWDLELAAEEEGHNKAGSALARWGRAAAGMSEEEGEGEEGAATA